MKSARHMAAVVISIACTGASASDTVTNATKGAGSGVDDEAYRQSAIAYLTVILPVKPSDVVAGPPSIDREGRMTVKAKAAGKNCTLTMVRSSPKKGYASDASEGWVVSCR